MRALALAYFGYFLYLGAQAPYWAYWLEEVTGLRNDQVGSVFLVFTFSILAGGLLWGHLSDRYRARRLLQRGTSLLGTLVCLIWPAVESFPGALLLAVPFGLAVGGQIPMLDATAIDRLGIRRERYGRLRLYGTLGFAVAASVLGSLRDGHPERIMLWMTCGFGVWHLMTWFLPDTQEAHPEGEARPRRSPLSLLRQRPILFLAISAYLHTLAFAAREIFGTLHFEKTVGLSGAQIGNLYLAEMVAEVAAFIAVPRLLALFHPAQLMVAAHVLTALRWGGLASTGDYPTLLALETLHAATYGLWWGAMIQLLGNLVRPELRTSGQALLSMAFAIGMGSGARLAGFVSQTWSSPTSFSVACVLSLMNAILIAILLPYLRRQRAP